MKKSVISEQNVQIEDKTIKILSALEDKSPFEVMTLIIELGSILNQDVELQGRDLKTKIAILKKRDWPLLQTETIKNGFILDVMNDSFTRVNKSWSDYLPAIEYISQEKLLSSSTLVNAPIIPAVFALLKYRVDNSEKNLEFKKSPSKELLLKFCKLSFIFKLGLELLNYAAFNEEEKIVDQLKAQILSIVNGKFFSDSNLDEWIDYKKQREMMYEGFLNIRNKIKVRKEIENKIKDRRFDVIKYSEAEKTNEILRALENKNPFKVITLIIELGSILNQELELKGKSLEDQLKKLEKRVWPSLQKETIKNGFILDIMFDSFSEFVNGWDTYFPSIKGRFDIRLVHNSLAFTNGSMFRAVIVMLKNRGYDKAENRKFRKTPSGKLLKEFCKLCFIFKLGLELLAYAANEKTDILDSVKRDIYCIINHSFFRKSNDSEKIINYVEQHELMIKEFARMKTNKPHNTPRSQSKASSPMIFKEPLRKESSRSFIIIQDGSQNLSDDLSFAEKHDFSDF